MTRNEKDRGPEFKVDPNAWMVTFADLTMLLLTFFVMLLTMKSMDAGKVREMFLPTSGPLDYMQREDLFEYDQYIRPVSITSVEVMEEVFAFSKGIDAPAAKEHPPVNLKETLEITESQRGVCLSLNADELFESGDAGIRADRLHILDEIGRVLRFTTNDIIIMGHTDNVPVTGGRFSSNMELSAYRALKVLYYFTDSLGLKPERLAAGGYGELLPRGPNDSPENRAKNRRVEFLLKRPL